jgi:PAS domain S-box-containing protein
MNFKEMREKELIHELKKSKEVIVTLNEELKYQNDEKERKAKEFVVANKELKYQNKEIDRMRTGSEAISKELRQFIETANAPIFGIDSKGLVNEWNRNSEKVTGFTKEETLGQDFVKSYISADYQDQVKEVLDNALKGEETANYELPLFGKYGERVVVLLNSSTRRDIDGNITGVIGVGQDISEMDNYKVNLESTVRSRTFELEKSLIKEKELGKLKTSFVAMASHEFRTPLTAILATTDVILRYKDKLSQEDIEKRLFKIKREVFDMSTMLEDILVLGKADSQKLEFNPIELNLVDLLKKIVLDYQLAQEKQREVIYNLSMDKVMLHADPKWIKHIVINLLSNAMKYSTAPASIIFEIQQAKNEVILSVTDKGIGISKKDQETLFEPFYRGKNVGNIEGTGLGLSILQKSVVLHKGHIEVFSEPNKGTEFRIIFPSQIINERARQPL